VEVMLQCLDICTIKTVAAFKNVGHCLCHESRCCGGQRGTDGYQV